MSETGTDRRPEATTRVAPPEIFEEFARYCGVVFWITDLDKSRIEYVSPAFERIFGYPPQELLDGSRHLLDAVHPDDRGSFLEALPKQASGNWDLVYRIVRDDGEVRTLRAQAFPIPDPDGTVGRVAGVTEDITEQCRANEARSTSDERFRMLVENAADAMFLHDLDGRIVDVNRQACTALGYERDELMAMHVWDVDAVHDEARARALWANLPRTTEPLAFASRHRRRDGSDFPVEIRLRMLDGGPTPLALVTARDVSDRRALSEQMESFFDLALDCLCIVDMEGHFQYVSPGFERVLGRTAAEICATPFLELVHPADRDRTTETVQGVMAGHAVPSSINRYRHADGSYRWLEWAGRANEDRTRIYAVARDITQSRHEAAIVAQTHRVARVGGWEIDVLSGDLYWTNETYRLHETTPEEYTPTVATAIEFYTPSSLPVITRAVEAALARGEGFDLRLEIVTARGNRRWVRAVGLVESDGERVTRVYGSFQDITAEREAEDRNRIVMSELDHRVKNTLSTVQALADRIAADANDLADFRNRFEERIQALARTHEIIAATKWMDVDLRALIDANLAPYLPEDGEREGDVSIEGPALPLPASAAGPLGMTLHELTTNAVKHGALSNPGARLSVAWDLTDEGVRLTWIESGVSSRPPNGSGLGTTLVRGFVDFQLRGQVTMDFTDDGLQCIITAPIAAPATEAAHDTVG